jgi:hypothetical protein
LPVPRAFGHARSRVSTLNRVLARQEKEIIETARTLDSKLERFKINKYWFKMPRAADRFLLERKTT